MDDLKLDGFDEKVLRYQIVPSALSSACAATKTVWATPEHRVVRKSGKQIAFAVARRGVRFIRRLVG